MNIEAFSAKTGMDTEDITDLLSELAMGAYKRYMQIGHRNDISEAIMWAKQGIHLANDSNPLLRLWLNNLGLFLESRYVRTGEMRDLEEAIQTARRAVELTPNDHPDQAAMWNNLGSKLGLRYKRMGEMRDLEDSIETARRAVELTPDDHPGLAASLNNLGVILVSRYERTGEMGDLEQAIQTARRAVGSTPDDHPDLAGRLSNLGNKLGLRYERTGEMRDLEQAIETGRQAVKSTPDDHPNLAGRLNNLGNKLESRYQRTGEMKDLEQAIETARQAVKSTPDDHPNLAAMLSSLGIMLEKRYGRRGEMKDLEEAIKVARQAVESTPDGHQDMAERWSNLGNKLGRRYERTGEMRDLEEAIQTARRAVELTPNDHPGLAGRQNSLGTELQSRYQRTGEMRDLEEAIQTARQAVESTPNDHADLAGRLSNLGTKLGLRYERTGEMRDLEQAIETGRQAIKSTPDDHPDMAGWLNNLGNKLESRYQRTGEMKDLEQAIETARQAVKSTPDDHPNLATWLSNLGNKLVRRYERTREMDDLEKAIETTRQAIKSTPDDHPNRAAWLNNVGRFLERLYEQTGEMRDLGEASAYLLQAWSCLNAVPFSRITAAAKCLELLAKQNRVDQGIDLGRRILDLLPSVHTRALDRNDQQFVISTFAGVASDLCSFLLSVNRLSEALECLEQGRAIIISQLLDDRSDLSSLRQGHPLLANRYQSLVDEVNAPIRQTTPGVVEALSRKRRQEAAAELKRCLKEIRCIPGHERFMLGQTVAEMQECITEGSIVVINVTDFRSDAIIIFNNSLRTIALPELSAPKARLWVSQDWSTKMKSEQRGKNDKFLDYLSWLWHACVKHIVAEISASQAHPSEGLPRVWWIGSGLASSMPFHAAGVHRRGSKENAYCRMTSSYTPSIKALGYAQKQAKRVEEALMAQDTNTMLIAVMPTSPKGSGDKKAPKKLPGVEEEMREIFVLARPHMRTTVRKHPSADQVLEVLKTCRIAHFACHGISDICDPSNSGLILQKSAGPDEALVQDRLTVQRISELRLRYAQIAYLSACSTAENKAARLSDEVIHVVSGFQVAGFPHVVGCLWPAGDSECVEVAKRFYSLVLQRNQSVISTEVALTVQEAVMAVRAEDLSMPLNWAQFVHYGV
ncbi:Tetratricopeptide-like helical domain superfamily [Fusarium oxysporum f. sp. vasinfectum]|nr:Tetratricopeptide-like helical domain superfamily [Fusarium oxysporum f. sp. vasinfectum]